MIHEVDSALRTLIEREAEGTRDVEIVFDAPTRDWAGRRNSPTIDVYLYDIREDLRRRERGMHNVYENNVVVSRHLPPRHFKLSYLVTAWTQRPEDEHRLLSSLLSCFLKYEALPADVLTGPLTDLGLPIPITIALPPPEDRAFADVWSALGGELKPSIDLVVITPLNTGQQFHTGLPVERPPRISLGGSNGWPTRETKSRNGVEVWPDGTTGPTPTDSGQPARASSGEDSAPQADEQPAQSTRTSKRAAGKGSRASAGKGATSGAADGSTDRPNAEAGQRDDPSAVRAADAAWEVATGWADAMTPLGAADAPALLPERAAGRRPPGGGPTRAGAEPAAAGGERPGAGGTEPAGGGTGPADDASAADGGAATAEANDKPGPTRGRPGTRVAMTRVRQTKKRS